MFLNKRTLNCKHPAKPLQRQKNHSATLLQSGFKISRKTAQNINNPSNVWQNPSNHLAGYINFLHFFVPNACKIQASQTSDHLPPLRDKSVQHSLKKRQILQKSAHPVGQVVNFYQQLTTLKIRHFACFLGHFYQNFVYLINAYFRDMLIFSLWCHILY